MQTASQDVIRYLEHGFDCWNRRAIKDMMDMYAVDAEVDLSKFLPDENVLRGREQIGAYYDRMWDTWSGYSWKPCGEVADLGDDRYAMLVRIDAEGRGSGAPAGTEATIFYTLVDGLIARAEFEPGRSPQLQS
ncbi:MAG: nuclear transport factor 2 family protein [Thermoleophilaceae bacterium]